MMGRYNHPLDCGRDSCQCLSYGSLPHAVLHEVHRVLATDPSSSRRSALTWREWGPETALNTSKQPGPSKPIIEAVSQVADRLDISWVTDVTSEQDKYIMVYKHQVH